ncbi:hypothetical protein ACJJTC_002981 [Scirpophaga incertulas]
MQQKGPVVPGRSKLQESLPQSKAFSGNFFKTTFSSRSKAVPSTTTTVEVVETTKIGSAETKPITRNRPRTAVLSETATKVKLKRTDPNKPLPKRPDKLLVAPKKPDRKLPITIHEQELKTSNNLKNDLKSPTAVLQIVKKHSSQIPEATILPPTLKPKVVDTKLKLTKNINNNDVWTTAHENGTRTHTKYSPIITFGYSGCGKSRTELQELVIQKHRLGRHVRYASPIILQFCRRHVYLYGVR